MTPSTLSLAFTPRLTALAAKLNRKPIRRRLPVPYSLSTWSIVTHLRAQFRKEYGCIIGEYK